jgi:hypothetical protein
VSEDNHLKPIEIQNKTTQIALKTFQSQKLRVLYDTVRFFYLNNYSVHMPLSLHKCMDIKMYLEWTQHIHVLKEGMARLNIYLVQSRVVMYMVYFNTNLSTFWRAFEWKMLECFGHFDYFTIFW